MQICVYFLKDELKKPFGFFAGKGIIQMSDLTFALGCLKLSLPDTEVQELIALSGLFLTDDKVRLVL